MSSRRTPFLLCLSLSLTLCLSPAATRARPEQRAGGSNPRVVISLASATLRVEGATAGERRVYPVGVGRRTPDGLASPVGLFRTGADPRDRLFYDPARRAPAFHRGLPFLRIDLPTTGRHRGQPIRPYGIHGPVTPSLIWGRISAGCVRMRAPDIRALYRLAVAHPRMAVRFTRQADPLADRALAQRGSRCPEALGGARRLVGLEGRASLRHDRLCGVDHWYAITLQGGQLLSVELGHDGALAVELYGMRAISVVARGVLGLRFSVPAARRNRGPRYLRVFVASRGAQRADSEASARVWPYTLRVGRL